MILLINNYWDYTHLYDDPHTTLDVVYYAHFVDDLIHGIYYEHDINGTSVNYMPVIPFLLGLIALPLNVLGVHIFRATLIAASVYMGLASLGLYMQLRSYNVSEFNAAVLTIVNPFTIIMFFPWGGFSMEITTGCIAWIITISKYIKTNPERKNLGIIIMLFLFLTSLTGHRTGTIIQLSFLTLYAIMHLLNKKQEFNHQFYIILFLIFILAILLFVFRVLPLLDNLTFSRELIIDKSRWVLRFPLRLYLPFFVFLIGGIILGLKELRVNREYLLRVDVIYAISGLLLFLYPLEDLELSPRFVSSFLGLYYYLFLYFEKRMRNMRYAMYIKILHFLSIIYIHYRAISFSIYLLEFFRDNF